MPVYDASYRAWDGKAKATPLAALAIASTTVRRMWRIRSVKWLTVICPLAACSISWLVLYFAYEKIWATVTERIGLAEFNILHLVNVYLLTWVLPFAVLLAAIVGGPLIAEDRRAHSLPLYFSRPITHITYTLGKFLTIFAYLSLLVLLPSIGMYMIDVSLSPASGHWLAQFPSLLRSLACGSLLIAVLSCVALGASSLCTRNNYAVALILSLMMVVWIGSNIASEAMDNANGRLVSPLAAISTVMVDLLEIPELLYPPNLRGRTMPDLNLAWISLAAWIGGPLLVLIARVRKVEVVS